MVMWNTFNVTMWLLNINVYDYYLLYLVANENSYK